MKPIIHAESSARKFGGQPEDYLEIHNFMDSSKSVIADNRHRALTHNTDDYLGWMKLDLPNHPNHYFSVRELSPYKQHFDPSNWNQIEAFKSLTETWGTILATAHARADKNFDDTFISYSFDKQIHKITDGHHKEFRQLVRGIAFDYADQVQQDWTTFITSSLVQ